MHRLRITGPGAVRVLLVLAVILNSVLFAISSPQPTKASDQTYPLFSSDNQADQSLIKFIDHESRLDWVSVDLSVVEPVDSGTSSFLRMIVQSKENEWYPAGKCCPQSHTSPSRLADGTLTIAVPEEMSIDYDEIEVKGGGAFPGEPEIPMHTLEEDASGTWNTILDILNLLFSKLPLIEKGYDIMDLAHLWKCLKEQENPPESPTSNTPFDDKNEYDVLSIPWHVDLYEEGWYQSYEVPKIVVEIPFSEPQGALGLMDLLHRRPLALHLDQEYRLRYSRDVYLNTIEMVVSDVLETWQGPGIAEGEYISQEWTLLDTGPPSTGPVDQVQGKGTHLLGPETPSRCHGDFCFESYDAAGLDLQLAVVPLQGPVAHSALRLRLRPWEGEGRLVDNAAGFYDGGAVSLAIPEALSVSREKVTYIDDGSQRTEIFLGPDDCGGWELIGKTIIEQVFETMLEVTGTPTFVRYITAVPEALVIFAPEGASEPDLAEGTRFDLTHANDFDSVVVAWDKDILADQTLEIAIPLHNSIDDVMAAISSSNIALRVQTKMSWSCSYCEYQYYRDDIDLLWGKIGEPNVPSISLLSPTASDPPVTIGEAIPIEAQATDEFEIDRVEFTILTSSDSAQSLGSDSTAPYSTTWDTSAHQPGDYVISAMVYDTSGNSSTDEVVARLVQQPVIHDLSIGDLSSSSTSPNADDSVTFQVTVRNRGTEDESNVPLRLLIDGAVEQTEYLTIAAGETITESFEPWMAIGGPHNIEVKLSLPEDLDQSDNYDSITMNVAVPGLLEVDGSTAPPPMLLNVEQGVTVDKSVALRNIGDRSLTVSVSASTSADLVVSWLTSTPVGVPARQSRQFQFSVSCSASEGSACSGTIHFASAGGDVDLPLEVHVAQFVADVPVSIPMASGTVANSPPYEDTVDLTAYREVIGGGLAWAKVEFTIDNVTTCDQGYANYVVYVVDGGYPSATGSGSAHCADIPADKTVSVLGRLVDGEDSLLIRIQSNHDIFHIKDVNFKFLAHEGDPNIVAARSLASAEISINGTTTVDLAFSNVGSNSATDVQFDDSPLSSGLALVSGELNDNVGTIQPEEVDTDSYQIRGILPGQYTFPTTRVTYENRAGTQLFATTLNSSVLTVNGGTLQPSVSFASDAVYAGAPQQIYATVQDSITSNPVVDATVLATVSDPQGGNHSVHLLYDTTYALYRGTFAKTDLAGTYAVHVSASRDFYTTGDTSSDSTFEAVSPYRLSLTPTSLSKATRPNRPVDFGLTLQNTGSVAEVINLSQIDLPSDWLVGLSPSQIVLKPGESDIVRVMILPGETVSDGEYNFDVIATSERDPSARARSSLTVGIDSQPPGFSPVPSWNSELIRNGDTLTVTLGLTETATLSADFASVDSQFDVSRLVINEVDPSTHSYQLVYSISLNNTRGDDQYVIPIDVSDAVGNVKRYPLIIWLENQSPEVVAIQPDDGDTVSVNDNIQILFSEEMDRSTSENAFNLLPPANGTFNWTGRLMTFLPSQLLAYDTEYTVTIDDVALDMAGNPITPAEWSFTTESAFPSISHTPPVNASEGSALNVCATVTSPLTPFTVTLFHRIAGQSAYQQISLLNTTSDSYCGEIPGDWVQVEGLEYYISATNDAGTSTNGTADTPHYIEVTPKWISHEFTIRPGWNLVGLPIVPETDYSVETLCSEIAIQGGVIEEVNRWFAGGWEPHICGGDSNNFDIVVGNGYFIRSTVNSTWTITGTNIPLPFSRSLSSSWNLISLPPQANYTAEELGETINEQGGACIEIDRWYAGGWEPHLIGSLSNDYAIEAGKGYFVKCQQSSTFVLNSPVE